MGEPDDFKEKQRKIMEIISTEILETDPDFNEHTDLFAAGLDSMATMQLVIRLEQNFRIKLPAGKMTKENFSSAAALARMI
jgi:acyl carrier protein